MAANPKALYTPDQYLTVERAAASRSEYLSGHVYSMAGASERHNRINANIQILIGSQLRGKPCQTYTSDMRVSIGTAFLYPDLVVVCGDVKLRDDGYLDNLLNPTVIIEVLSKSTELYDRGEKFIRYGEIDSLKEYVLVAQDKPRVERFTRIAEGGWHLSIFTKSEDVVDFKAIECHVSLSDIYDRIEFPNVIEIVGPEPGTR